MGSIIINKNVLDQKKCYLNLFFYKKARYGFFELLKELKKQGDYTIFLPAYIGYSPNEGSGIDDPIEELQYKKVFYKIDAELNIDINDLKTKIKEVKGLKILLLVHYFGYVDPKIENIVKYAKNNGMIIIEDCAHAFYTDFVDKKCGKYGDFCLYSLHKMFPLDDGGMIKINNSNNSLQLSSTVVYDLFRYDIVEIAEKRKRNAKIIYDNLKDMEEITILRNDDSITPQTFPILLDEKIKEKVYFKMNELGYQIVALCFRMIPQIDKLTYADSYKVSQKILNLPIHQDIDEKDLIDMCKALKKVVSDLKKDG